MTIAIDSSSAANSSSSGSAATKKSETDASDRFLKLLVAQMKNQDPLNPLDNAQVTSQMAQISTVSGIEKLNTTIETMSSNFATNQSMQGAALVGRDVVLEGNRIVLDAEGSARGAFELDSAADSVRVEIQSAAGATLDSLVLGAQGAGQHGFTWQLPDNVDPKLVSSFKVTALAGTKAVGATSYMFDKVQAVLTGGPQLRLELQSNGSVPYSQIKAFN